MKRIGILLFVLLAAMLVFSGCQKEADATVTCAGCEMQMAKDLAKDVDGKHYCGACAVKAEAAGAAEAAMVTCAGGCGMQVAAVAANESGGKHDCAGCLAHAGHDHSAGGEHPKAGDEKPPAGAEAH